MQSLAQQHWEHHTTNPGTPAGVVVHRDSRELEARHQVMHTKLQVDVIQLRAMRSRERRNIHKQSLLQDYADYLSVVINSGATCTNTVLVQCCIWAMDCENWQLCLQLADHAISNGMDSPANYTRTLAEILLEEAAYTVAHSDHPDQYAAHLDNLAALTAGQDLHDEIKAKFYKAQGLALEPNQPQAALLAYQQANHYGARVQGKIKQLTDKVTTHDDH